MRVAVLLAFAGCWTAPVPPPHRAAPDVRPLAETQPPPRPRLVPRRGPTRCAVAIDHAFEVSRPEFDQVAQLRDKIEALRDAVIESCQSTDWSDETLTCFEEVSQPAEMRGCQSKLTAAQAEELRRRLNDVFSPTP